MIEQKPLSILPKLGEITSLPTLPHVASDLIWRLNDPETTLKDISGPLAQDPGLAAQVLRMVNSAYYALGNEVTSLAHAVALLGYRTVQTVLLGAAARGVFRQRCRSPRMKQEAMTLHSIATAAVARHLARVSRVVDPELAFSVGLLHDMGKLALDQMAPDRYTAVHDRAQADDTSAAEAETALDMPGHGEMGGELADHWRLPPMIVDGVAHHHSTTLAEDPQLAAVLVVSDYICLVKALRAPDNFAEARLDRDAWQMLCIPSTALAQILTEVDEHVAKAREMFAI